MKTWVLFCVLGTWGVAAQAQYHLEWSNRGHISYRPGFDTERSLSGHEALCTGPDGRLLSSYNLFRFYFGDTLLVSRNLTPYQFQTGREVALLSYASNGSPIWFRLSDSGMNGLWSAGLKRLGGDNFVWGGIASRSDYPRELTDTVTVWGWPKGRAHYTPFLLYFTKDGTLQNRLQVEADTNFWGEIYRLDVDKKGRVYTAGFYTDANARLDTGSQYVAPSLPPVPVGPDTLRLRAVDKKPTDSEQGGSPYSISDMLVTAANPDGSWRWAKDGGGYNNLDRAYVIRQWTDSTLLVLGHCGSGAQFDTFRLDSLPEYYKTWFGRVKRNANSGESCACIYDTSGHVLDAHFIMVTPKKNTLGKIDTVLETSAFFFNEAITDAEDNMYLFVNGWSIRDSVDVFGRRFSWLSLMQESGFSQNSIDLFLNQRPVPLRWIIKLNAQGQLLWVRLYPADVYSSFRSISAPFQFIEYDNKLILSGYREIQQPNNVTGYEFVVYEVKKTTGDLESIISLNANPIGISNAITIDDCGHIYVGGQFKGQFTSIFPVQDTIFRLDNPEDVDVFLLKYRREGSLYLPGEEAKQPSNHEAKDGSLRIIAAEGEQPYTYVWSHDATLNTPEAKDLAPGIYQVTVTDARGCKQMAHFNLKERPVQFRNLITRPTTDGLDNGEIRMAAVGGQAPYQYSIDDGMTWLSDRKFKDLAAGTYLAAIRDVSGTIVRSEVLIRTR